METVAQDRSDVLAHRDSLMYSTPQVVMELDATLGRKMTAYVGGVKDTRAVERWMQGGQMYGEAEQRLRLTFQVARLLAYHEPNSVIQGWFMGMNPELGDRSPIRLLKDEPLEKCGPEVLGAARAFLAQG